MTTRTKYSAAAVRFTAILLLAAPWNSSGAAGLVEVTQTIFGMDCAPCAHGVKKSLMKLDGVSKATVSLNDGYARVELLDGSAVSLERIREVIRENGFTPKQAQIVVAGYLSHSKGYAVLTFSHNELLLTAPADTGSLRQLLDEAESGAPLRISGKVEESDPGRILVSRVERIE